MFTTSHVDSFRKWVWAIKRNTNDVKLEQSERKSDEVQTTGGKMGYRTMLDNRYYCYLMKDNEKKRKKKRKLTCVKPRFMR